MDELIGVVKLFAGNFAPRNFMFCHGQLLRIARFRELFSLLGTTYGGNGRTTFALPDLRGRVPIGPGGGRGLSDYLLGEQGGVESHTLVLDEMPSHNHSVNAVRNEPNVGDPINSLPAKGNFYHNGRATTTMNAGMIDTTGADRPHQNMQPYLALHYIICVKGIFPERE